MPIVSASIDTLTFDAADARRLAGFWGAALGFDLDEDSDEEGAYLADPSGRTRGIFFQRVPESKHAKNRVHLDLRPSGSMREEVERLRGLGATGDEVVEIPASAVDGQSTFWTVMADPEGNEFCVLRGPDDGWEPS
jgi:predicted enzyme related to lactoylglutathione lyase